MSTSRALLHVLKRLALLVGMCLLMAPLWPLYGLVRLFRPRPPILPSARRTLDTLGLILTVKAPEPGLRPLARLSLAIELLNRWAPTPAAGLAWALDDLLYGRALAQTEIHAPLFELSAARSGSTQLAHYLEDDPQIAAPNTLQGLFPYLWLWRLAPHAPAWLMTREKLGQKLLDRLAWWAEYTRGHHAQFNGVVGHGNQAGGLANIFEKSLGSAMKAGTTPLQGVYEYAEPITQKGFVFMDSPGYDPVAATGQIASGANLICFTTGRGSMFGSKPAPTIKLASNTAMYERLRDDMDINCGTILDGQHSVQEMGQLIFDAILRHASGESTCSELLGLGDHEFIPWHLGVVS